MSLGAGIGAITFSGSIIAFLKLKGIMSGAPITFKGQHYLNLILGISIFILIFYNIYIAKYLINLNHLELGGINNHYNVNLSIEGFK